jgi:amidohydrolase
VSAPWTADRVAGLFDRLQTHLGDAVTLRRRLHSDPHVGGDEEDTTVVVAAALGLSETLLTTGGAVLRIGGGDGPAVGLRAELDALPVRETTGVTWSSTNDAMHACGHDVHLAAAVAVARTLQEQPGPLPLVLVLQPREETLPSGAQDIVASAAFTGQDLRAFVGVHVQPRLAQGQFAATPGAVNAAADVFTIVVTGRPGHAAYPHTTADPIVAAADLIGTLQHLVARRVDPVHPTVLSVGSITGGSSANVIPAAVRMSGILRTFDEQDRVTLHSLIGSCADAITEAHGCDAEVQISLGAPMLDNDPALATAAATWIQHAGLEPAPPLRSCGADDFSYYCPLQPSLMVFVGVGSGGPDEPGLHHPAFLPPDQAVSDVATAMLAGYLGACSTVVDLPVPT